MANKELLELIEYLKEGGFLESKKVEEALLAIDRAHFVPEKWKRHSFPYGDIALPIVDDVTISAPSVIARTFELAALQEGENVLEIGTGSGYTAALASFLVGEAGKVVSVEVNEKAYEYAKEKLKSAKAKFGLPDNIELFNADGKEFFYRERFFDAVLIHAAFSNIESSWLKQMKEGGRLVGPLMEEGIQHLVKYEQGKVVEDIPVIYVRLR